MSIIKTKEIGKKRKQRIEDKSKLIVFTLVALIVLSSLVLTVYNIQKIRKIEQEEEIFISPERFIFKSDEEPLFRINKTKLSKVSTKGESSFYIVNPNNKTKKISDEEIEEKPDGSIEIKIKKERQFTPGVYVLEIRSGEDTIIRQDFAWGVLALNTHKSIYLENELADIGIAVLDDQGHMVCDADVTLEITDPDGVKTTLTTPNDIIVTDACYVYDITQRPDYYTIYTVNSEGTYFINLTAVTYAGTWNIEDNFTVTKKVDFDVTRKHWTRIYPAVNYTMDITIKANKNYKGTIRDYVPSSFGIYGEGFTITENEDEKILSWNVDLKKDDTINLVYTIDYPDISPEFYLLGKLDIGDWQEQRYWQIANDKPGKIEDDYVNLNQTSVDEGQRLEVEGSYDNTGDLASFTIQLMSTSATYTTDNINGDCTDAEGITEGFMVTAIDTSGCVGSCTPNVAAGTVALTLDKNDDDNVITWTLQACSDGHLGSQFPKIETIETTGAQKKLDADTQPITVNEVVMDYSADITINGQLNGNTGITYPTNAQVNGTCGANAGICYLYGNISGSMQLLHSDGGAPFFVENISSVSAGYYMYKINNTNNATGRTNYLTVNQGTGDVTLYINSSESDFKQNVTFDANITCTLTTPSSGNLTIYENGTVIKSGIDSYINITRTYSIIGDYNITCSLLEHQNYTASDYSWINATDGDSPAPITNLNSPSQGATWIYWNWTNPGDADFSKSIIYIEESNLVNTSNSYYNATGLSPGIDYEITVHTKDTTGNINDIDIDNENSTLSLINESIEDAHGNKLNTTIEVFDDKNNLKYNQTSESHNIGVKKGIYKVKITLKDHPVKEVVFNDLNVSGKISNIINIDDPDNSNFMELYALNKSVTDYSNMTITVSAKGTKLYRCANWSFAERTCLGYWVEHMNLTRNEEYNLSQTSAYAETGLIAINTHKGIYLENEIANISIGVLDTEGTVICDADVTLLITDPSSVTTNLTTIDGDIIVSDICSAHNKTYVPDYSTDYTVGGVGNYFMNATAEINNSLKPNITSNFEVRSNVSFDVIRSTATRIVLFSNYSVNFTIKANENFTGNMTEVVEPGFNITSQDGLVVEKYEDYTLLKFNVSFVNGSTYNIGYEYDAPDVSPELFLLGPLRIGNFSEARVWQIASDAAPCKIADDYFTITPGSIEEGEKTNISASYSNTGGTKDNNCVLTITEGGVTVTSGGGTAVKLTEIYFAGTICGPRNLVTGELTCNAWGAADDNQLIYWELEGQTGGGGSKTYTTVVATCTDNAVRTAVLTVNAAVYDYSVNITVNGQFNGDTGITYPTNAQVNGTCGPDAGTCYLYGNISGSMQMLDSKVGSPFFVEDISSVSAGYYMYKVNNTGNATGRTHYLTVSKATGDVALYINNSESDFKQNVTFDANLTCVLTTGTGNINLYNNGTPIDNGGSPLENITTYTTVGDYNITCKYDGNQNYTADSSMHWVNATDGTNPQLIITSANNTLSNILTTIEGTAFDENPDTIYANNTNWNWNNTYTNWGFVNNTNIADGIYHILITANDTFGNTNSSLFVFSYDATPPELFIFEPPTEDNYANKSQDWYYVNITFTETNPDSCLLDNGATNTSMSISGTNCYVNMTSQSEATHTYKVWANDTVGNWGVSSERNIILDTTKPTVSSASAVPDPAKAGSVTITVLFTESGSLMNNSVAPTVQFAYPNTTNVAVSVSSYSGTTWEGTATVSSGSDGTATIKVSGATDNAANTMDVNDTAGTFTIDATPPASFSFESPTEGDYANKSQDWYYVNVTFTETNPDSCLLDNGTTNTSMSISGTNCYVNMTSQPEATHTYKVWANDTAGNWGNSSERHITLDTTKPTYSSDADDSGESVEEGTVVNISTYWQDTYLDTAEFYHNVSGSYVLNSTCSLSGTADWCNKTIDTTGMIGKRICWKQYANDSAGNLNDTMTSHCFNVTLVNTAPTITANVTSPAIVYTNTDFKLNLTIIDPNTGQTLTGYVQFYVNNIANGSFQSQTAENGTSTLIGTLGSGNFSKDHNLIAEYWAGDSMDNTTKENVTQVTVQNLVPTIQVQNTFINCSAGHCFNVTAGVEDLDGYSDIIKTNISTTGGGSCYNIANSTSGNYFNSTWNCSGTALASTNIIIGFNDSSGVYVNTTLSSNVYPNQEPTQPSLTNPDNNSYVNSITMNWTSSDADNDPVYYHVLVNGTQVCYTIDLNCSNVTSDAYYIWNVTPYDGKVNGTTSDSWYYTYDTISPVLNFTSPTKPNGTIINKNWTQVNITIDEKNLYAFKFNWDNSNHTFYDDSLVLGLNFNNNSAIGENSSYAIDISSYGNDGTFYGTEGTNNLPQWTTGKFGSALQFDGTDDYVDCGNDTSLRLPTGNKISLEAWFKTSSTGVIVAKRKSGNTDLYGIFVYTDDIGFYFRGTDSSGVNYAKILGNYHDGVWYHVVATYDSSNGQFKAYLNGVNKTSETHTVNTDIALEGNLEIGTQYGTSPFTGTIDEVRIYNRILNSSEVLMHYKSEFSKYNSSQYRFYNNVTNLTDGTYTYYGWVNDSAGNSGQTYNGNLRYLTVDLTPPTPSNIGKNTTPKINEDVKFYTQWFDTNGLSHYVFSWNHSGIMENDSALSLTDWSNITKTITATGNPQIDWIIYANDSVGNWNNTGTQTFTMANTEPTITANTTKPDTVYTNTDWMLNLTISDPDSGDTITAYTQFYVNDSTAGSLHSLNVTDNTNTNVANLSSSLFGEEANLTAEFWAGDGTTNTTKENTTQVTVSIIYGTLSVSLSLPTDDTSVSQNDEFTINATINCIGSAEAKCGNVYALARYNKTISTPDTGINTTVGATPFYIVGTASNPENSPAVLDQGDSWNVSWTVNATGSTDTQYLIDVLFNSSYGSSNIENNDTTNPRICIGTCPVSPTTPIIIANATSPENVYTNTDFNLNLTITDTDNSTVTSYVQFYVNNTANGSVQSQTADNNTNTLIGILGSGNFSNDYKLIAEFWAGDGESNTTKYNTTEVTVGTIYGTLSVSLSLPSNNTAIPQNNTFTINATITCTGVTEAKCGNVYALARYNKTITTPDIGINTTVGATPFYIIGASNPQTSPSTLDKDQDWNVSWTVNATGPNYGNYLIDVLFNSSYGNNSVVESDTINPTVCIGACAKFWNATFNTTGKQTGQWNITTTASADWSFTHIFDDGRNFNLSSPVENTAPTIIANVTKPDNVYTNTNWMLNLTVTDPDVGDTITAYTQFYVNGSSVGSVINHEVSDNTNTNVANLISSDFGKGATLIAEFWAGDATVNTTKTNTTPQVTVLNSLPSKVVLSYPENNDSFFTNRTPKFNWTAATDADNDNLTYHFQISIHADVSSPLVDEENISNLYYTQENELDFDTYYWKVRANDSEEYGEWSDIWNFTLGPSISLVFINDTINFGSMDLEEINDTANDAPEPFILEQRGNTEANVSIKATSLWSSAYAQLNTSYFQFKAGNSTETNSFDWLNSQITWADMSDIYKEIIGTFNYSDSNDLAEIEIRVRVPSDEIPVQKSSTIIVYGIES